MKPPRELRHGESVKNLVEAWNTLVRYVRSITPRNGGTNVMVRTTPGGTTFEAVPRPRNRNAEAGGFSAPRDFHCTLSGNTVTVGTGTLFCPGRGVYTFAADRTRTEDFTVEVSGSCYVVLVFDPTGGDFELTVKTSLQVQESQLWLYLVHVSRTAGTDGEAPVFSIDRVLHEGSATWQ